MDRAQRITDYIQRSRRTYTKEAIRAALLARGYAASEIDEGFRAVEAGLAPPAERVVSTARFWLVAVGYVIGVYGITALSLLALPAEIGAMGLLFFVLALVGGIVGWIVYAGRDRAIAAGLATGVWTVVGLIFLVAVIGAGYCIVLLTQLG